MTHPNRREFAQTGAAGVLTALSASRVLGANRRIRLGFIGLGNRGDQVLDAFLPHKDAEIVALCDLYQPYLDFAAKKVGGSPKITKHYHDVLAMKDVDAVVICTPDHWHALQTIHACKAGKDVYVEKPLSLRVEEGRHMVEAARKGKRITQVGLMRRSSVFCRDACEFVRKGGIGHVTVARSFHIQNEFPHGIGNPPNEPDPKDWSWDDWCGPAAKVPYNRNRGFYRFRWFYDFSGGQLTNMGVHYLDLFQWALGQEAPLAVTAIGGKYAVNDNREIPDTLEVLWHYPGNTLATFSQYNCTAEAAGIRGDAVEFRGTKGTVYIEGNGWEVVPDGLADRDFPAYRPTDRALSKEYRASRKPVIAARKEKGKIDTADHTRNFLDCIVSRQPCNCDVEIGHRETTAALIGNIALKTKSHLEWDGKAEKFTNNTAANQLLRYDYRAPYRMPT